MSAVGAKQTRNAEHGWHSLASVPQPSEKNGQERVSSALLTAARFSPQRLRPQRPHQQQTAPLPCRQPRPIPLARPTAATATPASATNADEVLRVLRPTPRRILLAPARPAGDDADGAANDSSDGARARRGTLWDRPDVASTDVTPAYTAVDATSASAADAARAPPQAEAGEGEEHGELPPAYSDVAQREER